MYYAGWTLARFLLQLSSCLWFTSSKNHQLYAGRALSQFTTRFTNWWSNWSPTMTSVTLAGISCMLQNKCQTSDFPVVCVGVSLVRGQRLNISSPTCFFMGLFCFPPLSALQINAHWFSILLPYIYFIEATREGERQTDGHGHLDHLSLTHN